MPNIPYGRQHISEDDIKAVTEVLKSDFLTQGPAVPAFEKAVAHHCQAEHAVAVNSATSALHLACLALGVSKGDRVWTTPITFVATANCVRYCGADVDFIDIEPNTFNISAGQLETKLKQAKIENRLPKAVIVVHMCGQPCEMAGINALSNQYGFHVIEDASHAIGSEYQGLPTGNCRYSDITVFSFHPVKIITTGEGGVATTNNPELAARMRLLRSHGVTRDPAEMQGEPTGGWYYEQIELGFNYRMTDIQAALGSSQLKQLSGFIHKRHTIAEQYTELLKGLPVELPWTHPDTYSSFHLYVIRLKTDKIKNPHPTVFQNLRDNGIGVNLHYMPVYLQPYYRNLGFAEGYCPQAEQYSATAISLPMYPDLDAVSQQHVADALHKAID